MRRFEPKIFQLEGVEMCHRLRRSWLADEPGLGKTAQALLLFQRGQHDRAVIVCPSSLKDHWAREAWRWLDERAYVAQGARCTPPRRGIVVLSYEGLGRHGERLAAWQPGILLADEAHHIKGSGTKRTLAAVKLARTVPYVCLLTATPVVNHIAELWPQLQALRREDVVGGRSRFVREFCGGVRRTPFGVKYGTPGNLDLLNAKLRATCMVRRKKEDVMADMPPKIHDVRRVTLPPLGDYVRHMAQARLARTAEQGIGHITQARRVLGLSKVDAAVQWARDQMRQHPDDKVVIAGHHQDVLTSIARELSCPVIFGGVPQGERQGIVDRFQDGEQHRAIVISMRTAGVGFTLTRANRLLFAELDWTPSAHEQTGDRIHRIGQEKDCYFTWLLAPGTLDDHIMGLLERKADWFEAAVNDRDAGGMIYNAIKAGG